MKKLIGVLSIILLTSCFSTKQYVKFTHETPIEESTNKGRIYVIRSEKLVSAAVKTSIFCNDELIGNNGANSFFCWDVDEGTYRIGTTQFVHAGATMGTAFGEDVFTIKVKAGKTYYIREYTQFGSGFSFELMSKKEGETLSKKIKPPKFNFSE